ncbi:MAG TPA: hypothetical protein VM733_21095 [Thermoanaerobaculia bacterium]|nr:hypothetical protein [Thermoanaerobaculia bacterium]
MILVVDVRNDLIVADVLGYLLIFLFVRALADRSFRFARWCALIAGVASLVARFSSAVWPSLLQALFEVIMIFCLCSGVVHLAGDNASLARSAANARALTVVSGVLNFAYAILFYGFTIAIPHAGVVLLAFGWSVVAIVASVMLRAASSFPGR